MVITMNGLFVLDLCAVGFSVTDLGLPYICYTYIRHSNAYTNNS